MPSNHFTKSVARPRNASMLAAPLFVLVLALPPLHGPGRRQMMAGATITNANYLSAISDLYTSMGGASWQSRNNWMTGDPCDDAWYGIGCNGASDGVSTIDLEGNDLKGSLPTTIGLLATMDGTIDFTSNTITGYLPTEIGKLSLLESEVRFRQNSFSGPIPTQLGAVSRVASYFALATNQFEGQLPTELGKISLLTQWFNMRDLQLTGTIPTEVTRFTLLTTGYVLADNDFTGTIPSEVSRMSLLESFINFGNNKFTGTVPTEIGILSRCTTLLSFASNQLTGSIPTELGQASRISESFLLSDNELSGSIPTQIGQLSRLTRFFNLARNELTGLIPTSVGLMSLMQNSFVLTSNNLIGSIPSEIALYTDFGSNLDVTYNSLCGDLPDIVTTWATGVNNFKYDSGNFVGDACCEVSGGLYTCQPTPAPFMTPSPTVTAVPTVVPTSSPTALPTVPGGGGGGGEVALGDALIAVVSLGSALCCLAFLLLFRRCFKKDTVRTIGIQCDMECKENESIQVDSVEPKPVQPVDDDGKPIKASTREISTNTNSHFEDPEDPFSSQTVEAKHSSEDNRGIAMTQITSNDDANESKDWYDVDQIPGQRGGSKSRQTQVDRGDMEPLSGSKTNLNITVNVMDKSGRKMSSKRSKKDLKRGADPRVDLHIDQHQVTNGGRGGYHSTDDRMSRDSTDMNRRAHRRSRSHERNTKKLSSKHSTVSITKIVKEPTSSTQTVSTSSRRARRRGGSNGNGRRYRDSAESMASVPGEDTDSPSDSESNLSRHDRHSSSMGDVYGRKRGASRHNRASDDRMRSTGTSPTRVVNNVVKRGDAGHRASPMRQTRESRAMQRYQSAVERSTESTERRRLFVDSINGSPQQDNRAKIAMSLPRPRGSVQAAHSNNRSISHDNVDGEQEESLRDALARQHRIALENNQFGIAEELWENICAVDAMEAKKKEQQAAEAQAAETKEDAADNTTPASVEENGGGEEKI